jgi:hypothetical protein
LVHGLPAAPSLSRPRSLRPRLADLAHAVPWKVPIPQRRLRARVTASRKVPIPQRRPPPSRGRALCALASLISRTLFHGRSPSHSVDCAPALLLQGKSPSHSVDCARRMSDDLRVRRSTRAAAMGVICACGGDGRDLRVRRRGHSSPIAEGAKVPERDISAPSPIAEGARGSAPTRTRCQRHPPHAKSPPSALLHPLPFLH